jgi:hypothetical protein
VVVKSLLSKAGSKQELEATDEVVRMA